MNGDHERWEDATGAYVLGALPDDERAAFEEHLATCAACRAEAEELRVAAQALPLSGPPVLPPPALKARIMAEVEREAELLAGARDTPGPERERPRRRWSWRVPMPAVALACAALLAGVVAGGVLFGGGSDGRRYDMDSTLPQASAELDVTEDGAIIVANKLPMPEAGKVYMVWIQRPGRAPEPTSALFTPRRDGSATASVTGDMEGVATVLVNQEPLGGSTTPTSQPVLVASLAS
ncbi:anti-sigma factor [Solirubrobacter sp. CPCC 204708]|uniref:Regulator of SigK n=1 Tax=Solirubrobacter deserti TaxID=2282478 RepID=A0ABT4RNT0_9ACTN|nr:anti-sigma factor [Solirubrobacter deserti]MBE2318413.1 anti-sigma factor [Solirubrobacter deserti]MDA0140068.1 anti-sigma factor [Solirubrobacter deserti]